MAIDEATATSTTAVVRGAGLSWPLLLVGFVVGVGFFVPMVLWPAGTLAWPAGWIYVGIIAVNFLVNLVYLQRVNPELITQRMRLGAGTKGWDIVWAFLFAPVFFAIYVVAGFDAVRFEWSTMAPALWVLGLVVFAPGALLFTWSMGVNPFFEKTVRIQSERGHRVIDTGPYAFVRHPGYLGFVGWGLGTPLLLGSWWAFVPALASMVGLIIRTALEDQTLRAELEGYEAYTQRVRYRLVPGIW